MSGGDVVDGRAVVMRAPGELPHGLEVRGGEGGLLRVPGRGRRLEGGLRSRPVVQVVEEHQAQAPRGFRRELGLPGGDHGPVGLLGAGPVAPAGPYDPEGQPGTS
jgi:hypothetical protein